MSEDLGHYIRDLQCLGGASSSTHQAGRKQRRKKEREKSNIYRTGGVKERVDISRS